MIFNPTSAGMQSRSDVRQQQSTCRLMGVCEEFAGTEIGRTAQIMGGWAAQTLMP